MNKAKRRKINKGNPMASIIRGNMYVSTTHGSKTSIEPQRISFNFWNKKGRK